MIPPPLTSSAFTRSEAQYSAHAPTSSVRGSRSLKFSCPQRRMVAYQGAGGAAAARRRGARGVGTAVTPAAAEHARNSRRFMGSGLHAWRRDADDVGGMPKTRIVSCDGWAAPCPREPDRLPRLEAGTSRSAELVVATIADEQDMRRAQGELPTREQVHLRIRLGEAGNAGKEHRGFLAHAFRQNIVQDPLVRWRTKRARDLSQGLPEGGAAQHDIRAPGPPMPSVGIVVQTEP